MSTFDGWLTAHEAAEILGVSHATVTRYVDKGRLPSRRVGQNILIPKDATENFERPKRGNPAFHSKNSKSGKIAS